MKDAVAPLKDMAWFRSLLNAAIHNPFLGTAIGIVLTGIVLRNHRHDGCDGAVRRDPRWDGSLSMARQIATSHTCFTIIITLIGLPLLNPFIKLVKLVVRGDDPPAHRNSLAVDPHTLHSPWVALLAANKETAYMGKITSDMIAQSLDLVQKMNRGVKQDLLQKERIVDNVAESITIYLSKLSREELDDTESRKLVSLMHAVNDIERAADHAENIMYLAQSKAEKYQYHEHSVDEMASQFRNNIVRLNNDLMSPQTAVVFIDVLSNLERIGDLANNVGYAIRGDISKL